MSKRRGLIRELELAIEDGPEGIIDFTFRHSIPEPNSGCWIWLGPVQQSGYGYVVDPRQPIVRESMPRIAIHRIVCEIVHRPMLEEEHARHLCHNPGCVNYQHLAPGSRSDNLMDSVRSGRWTFVRGEGNGRARLTAAQVRQIRAECRRGTRGEWQRLSAKYSTPVSTLRKVVSRDTWEHT